ncbi:hypothetical protein [Catellatospora chokoriensis]|uniref:Uncharacterized protein n=1 Tax=Catellatospora chokoriensis TaxID=310353 RepID=A0A8J3NQ82_9ACTN|nr:hypothetical protein [Catellatospora chokoriensis]GIF88003.1 hypothetical protein Cch02nite_14470 [Catellatospora chokoriensis]
MIDLKELLDDRSTTPSDVTHHLRLQDVQGRITTRRRRRMTAGGALAAMVALVLIGYGVTPALRSAPQPAVTPSPLPRLIEGFPEYSGGARVVAAATTAPGATSVTVSWTPTTTDLRYFLRCGTGVPNGTLEYEMSINGHASHGGTCGSSSFSWPDHRQAAAEHDLRPGTPATVTMTAKGMVLWHEQEQKTEPQPVPSSAWMSLAVGENMAFADYPLPARPAALRPVEFEGTLVMGAVDHAPAEEHRWLRSDPADPLRPMSVTIAWRDRYDLRLRAQTPGTLGISLDGVEVNSPTWWDYEAGEVGFYWQTATYRPVPEVAGFTPPAPGSLVTLTVTPRDVTGAWLVQVIPGKEAA